MMGLIDLTGKKGLVAGIANEDSIAYGCARACRAAGADLAITYLDAKAEPYVRPLTEKLDSPIIVPCDVREPGQLEAVFQRVAQQWGRLDFVLHSIAWAPLHRDGWVFEEKYDGQRIVAYKDGASVRLLSRTGRDHAKRSPGVAAALAADGIAARLAGQAVRKFVYVPGQLVVR